MSAINSAHTPISDTQILSLLLRSIQEMRQHGSGDSLDCLLTQQKLLHLTIMTLQSQPTKPPLPPFDLTLQLSNFIKKINKITLNHSQKQTSDININLFLKAVDLLMVKALGKYVTPLRVLGELKVLTFNNLACIYKRKRKFGMAMTAVGFALQIEEVLSKGECAANRMNIVTTYLNKAAILSQMKKHQKAIEQIEKCLKIIKQIEQQTKAKLADIDNQNQRKIIEQKGNSHLDMKIMVYYNLGVEKEHLGLREGAKGYYQKARKISEEINNECMKNKLEQIMKKFEQNKKI